MARAKAKRTKTPDVRAPRRGTRDFHTASQAVIERLREKYGAESTLRLSDGGAKTSVTEVIPLGVDVLDYHVLGCGGLPVKRAIEVFAEEGKGKTSFLYSAFAAVQRMGGVGIMSVTEEVDEERAALFGVDLDKLIILQPDCMEEVGDQAKDAIELCSEHGLGPIVYGWDSVAATPTKAEITDGLAGQARVGARALCLSRLGRIFGRVLRDHRVSIIFINQVRQNIGVLFGDKMVTPGGMAIKFLSAIRLAILGGKKEDEDEDGGTAAVTPIFRTAKNKVARPYRSARVKLNFTTGWDNEWSTVEYGMTEGIVPKGAHRSSKKAYAAVMAAKDWKVRPSGLIVPQSVEDEPPV